MMVFNMMIEIGIPSVPHQRIRDIWEKSIKNDIPPTKDASHMYVLMHHQGVGTHVADLHEEVEDAMHPRELPAEKKDRTGD
jgi:hypothetical protein